MKDEQQKISYFLSLVIIATSFFGIIWYYDPLKIFHKPYKYKDYLQWNMRQQAAGIINNWDFDSVILGTSMLENTSSKEARNILGGKFVNISLSGSDFWEREIVMKYALNKKGISKIIYSLDDYALIDSRKGHSSYPFLSFNYLYDDNLVNDFNAYLNDKYLKCIFNFKNKKHCMGHKVTTDRPNAWYGSNTHAKRFGGLDKWFKAKNNSQIKGAFSAIVSTTKKIEKGEIVTDTEMDKKIATSKQYLNETIIDYAKKYPTTEFILIIPPYSRMQNAIDAQYNKPRFERVKQSIRYLVDASSRIKNIKVYGWGDTNYPDDIAHYKDLGHYHYSFNSQMLKYIKDKKGLLTNQNINKYLEVFTQKSLDYDVVSVGKRIEAYLENNK